MFYTNLVFTFIAIMKFNFRQLYGYEESTKIIYFMVPDNVSSLLRSPELICDNEYVMGLIPNQAD